MISFVEREKYVMRVYKETEKQPTHPAYPTRKFFTLGVG